jgi:hypothetical protein
MVEREKNRCRALTGEVRRVFGGNLMIFDMQNLRLLLAGVQTDRQIEPKRWRRRRWRAWKRDARERFQE